MNDPIAGWTVQRAVGRLAQGYSVEQVSWLCGYGRRSYAPRSSGSIMVAFLRQPDAIARTLFVEAWRAFAAAAQLGAPPPAASPAQLASSG